MYKKTMGEQSTVHLLQDGTLCKTQLLTMYKIYVINKQLHTLKQIKSTKKLINSVVVPSLKKSIQCLSFVTSKGAQSSED